MTFIVSVFKLRYHLLRRPHRLGKLFLSQPGRFASRIQNLSHIGLLAELFVSRFSVGAYTKSLVNKP